MILAIPFILSIAVGVQSSSELGGILCRLPKNGGYDCGFTSAHSAFYFDSDIGECIEFLFNGCGGNQNRFATKEECMQGCRSLTLCGKGLPLMDFAGNIKRCDGDRVPCPGSHECIGAGMSSVCCLKADRVCQLSIHTGTPCGVPPTTRSKYRSQTNRGGMDILCIINGGFSAQRLEESGVKLALPVFNGYLEISPL